MNPNVEELLQKAREEQQKAQQDARNEHLISLGLKDETKMKREYVDYYASDLAYDEDKDKCYIETNEAIAVTDEEYAEICKYHPANDEKILKADISMERLLNKVSTIILVIGILGGIIIMFHCFPEDSGYYSSSREFNPVIFSYGATAILSTILSYAFAQVLIQISLSLKNRKSLDD